MMKKERETGFLRKVSLLLVMSSIAIAIALLFRGRFAAVAVAVLYAFMVMAPVGWRYMRKYAGCAVEAIAADPCTFIKRRGGMFDPLVSSIFRPEELPGHWLSMAGLVSFVGPMVLLLLGYTAVGATPGAALSGALLLTFLLGSGLQGLCEGEVWGRHGRDALEDEVGVRSDGLMEEHSFRWIWWWGWVSDPTSGIPNGGCTGA